MSTKVSHGNPRDGRPDGPDADPAADSHLRYNINLKQDMIKSLEAITNPEHLLRGRRCRRLRLLAFTSMESEIFTEKVPGMFGTLIICLPSAHTGGEVVVKHNGNIDLENIRCKPVLCLLVLGRDSRGSYPSNPAIDASAEHSHLYYILDHEYTQAAISPNGLKAEDYVRVQALRDLTAELPFEVFLALLEKRDEGVPLEGVSDYNENGADIAMDVSRTCHEVNSLYALDGIPIADSLG
ncbi:hypothetical protein H4Q26_012515 [Puccinia striiformis f. sp. tritici PST-130]|nr:hypothetical protein H4Q26_012515 [Puccinia striiformis f. sp. tritici PST-130]